MPCNKLKGENMKKYVRDLTNWPPEPANWKGVHGAPAPSREQAIVKKVVRINQTGFDFICTFAGQDFNYPFSEKEVKTAEKLWTIFENNIGQSLSSIGMVEISED